MAGTLIDTAYMKAVSAGASIASQGTASPEGGNTKSSNSAHAAQTLIRSINNPAWANDPDAPIPAELREIRKAMQDLAGAMADATVRGGTGGKNASAPSPRR